MEMESTKGDIRVEAPVAEAREAFGSGRTRSLAWRKAQLAGLAKLLHEKAGDAFAAVNDDLGKHHVETFKDEVGLVLRSVNHALTNLERWVTPKKVPMPLSAFPSSGELVPEPLGVVLIFSCWNLPIGLALEPLLGALSAGNAVVLKPSELAPASAMFLADNIPKYLDDKAVKVIQGDPEVARVLLEQKWDKIFFTGSERIGRIIMSAAAKNLTPVTLELGGKCPAIVDKLHSSRDQKVAVQRIAGAKWGSCGGQACITVDYVLVDRSFAPTLVDLLVSQIKRSFQTRGHMARIVNKHHFRRLSNLMNEKEVADSVVHGGSVDPENLYIEPTILLDPPHDSSIMQEEIFGPILPIITVNKIEDSIKFVREKAKPLAIYAFTQDESLKRRIISETSSGSVTFNDTMVQYAVESLPFGGVGQSGFGRYHGKFSFDVFSHEKAVMKRSFLVEINFRYPPWNPTKLQLLRHLFSNSYLQLLLVLLGLRK